MYRLFGWWIRWQSCKMTAVAMQNHTDEDCLCPRAWSLAVFFERYMTEGAEGTLKDFGPKDPVVLLTVENDQCPTSKPA